MFNFAAKKTSSSCQPSQYDIGTLLANRKLPEPPSEIQSYGRSPGRSRPLPSPPGPSQSKPACIKQLSEQLKTKMNIPPPPPSKNKTPHPPVDTPPSPTQGETMKKSKKPPPPPMRPGKTAYGGTVGNDDSDEMRRKSDARLPYTAEVADVTVAAAYALEGMNMQCICAEFSGTRNELKSDLGMILRGKSESGLSKFLNL